MGRTTELRRELKRRFYPLAAALGFQIDNSFGPFGVDFRRFIPTQVKESREVKIQYKARHHE
jgi:hypothetical protein